MLHDNDPVGQAEHFESLRAADRTQRKDPARGEETGRGQCPPTNAVGIFSTIYLAGGMGGWLMVEKYWMAAPMATGAVTKI